MGRPHRVHRGKEPVSQHKKILDIAPKIRYNILAIVQMAAPPAQDGGRW